MLGQGFVPKTDLRELFNECHLGSDELLECVERDLEAVRERIRLVMIFSVLFFTSKDFRPCALIDPDIICGRRVEGILPFTCKASLPSSIRIFPRLPSSERAFCLITRLVSWRETTVIEDDVSILHEVTLGGTGKDRGDRHPRSVRGCSSGGSQDSRNVEVGEGARVGASSVVLADVPPHVSVAGVPSKVVGKVTEDSPSLAMDHSLQNMREYESGGGI